MKVVVVGYTEGVDALRDAGHEVTATDEFGTEALREAGVEDADAVVVGAEYPTQTIVANELNPDARIVMVADDAPEFVSGNADIILSTDLADRLPDAVQENAG